jgi:IS30 family transposase
MEVLHLWVEFAKKTYINKEKLKEYGIRQQIVGRLAWDRKIKSSTETAYRVDIDQRPDVVDSRSRIGDWEVDLGDTKVALPFVGQLCIFLHVSLLFLVGLKSG